MLRACGNEKNSRTSLCARGHLTVHADISLCTRTSHGARGLPDVHAAEAIFEAFARGYSRIHAVPRAWFTVHSKYLRRICHPFQTGFQG